MTASINTLKAVYDKHKNLKLAGEELKMPWQTLYYKLCKVNHPVVGDKAKYGSVTDKLAKYSEDLFQKMIPYAKDNNTSKAQASLDFEVKGLNVDVKSSCKKDPYANNDIKSGKGAIRWAISTRVQEGVADYLVCFLFEGYDAQEHGDVEKILLIPAEFFKNKQSISISVKKSKWYDFEVTEQELIDFFKEV